MHYDHILLLRMQKFILGGTIHHDLPGLPHTITVF